ncbi:hypothetical protein ACLMJK_001444 [Lecanora helva]
MSQTSEETPQLMACPSAIEFPDFSFWHDDRGFTSIDAQSFNSLSNYLRSRYTVNEVIHSGPYLVMYCEKVPGFETRPFTIAGCGGIWLSEGEGLPAELTLGDLGGSDEELHVEDEILADVNIYRLPSEDTLKQVSDYFPSAHYVTYLNTGLIIELPQKDDDTYFEEIAKMPRNIEGSTITLGYNNGTLTTTPMKRLKKPKPALLDDQCDDTNYVKTLGFFGPGAMLSSNEGSITTGVLLKKGEKQRLTVAFHSWAEEFDKYPDKLGDSNHFKAKQGDMVSGSPVGFVDSRFARTDVGFLHLSPGIQFSNRFVDIEAEAKILLPFEEISLGDEFMVDGYVNGRQLLKCLGMRRRVVREAIRERDFVVSKAHQHFSPPLGDHVAHLQGVYATTTPIIRGSPRMRAGVCGSAILRSRKIGTGNVTSQGGVAGFMEYSDLRPKSRGDEQVLCFVEALNGVINDDMEVVRAAEKRKVEVEDQD